MDNRIHIDTTKSGPDPLLTELEEARLVNHLRYMSDMGYGYTRMQVMELGTDLAIHLGKKTKSEPLLSRFWFSNFMKRWPEIHVAKPRGLATIRAKCASPEKIAAYYEELDRIQTKYNLKNKPHLMYNVDEKGLPTEHSPPDTVCGKDSAAQSITSPKDKTTTVIGAGNAVGNQIPPFYIFAGKRKVDHLIEGCLPGTDFDVSETGWSNAEVFESYMKDHFFKFAHPGDGEHLLVLYDGHASHVTLSLIDWAKEQRIILFLLPPHTSHVLQPLDVGCFGPLQRIYNRECSTYLRQHPGQVVCRLNICKISSKAYSLALSPENLRSSFRRAGIYPFDPTAVPLYLLKPSEIFKQPCQENVDILSTQSQHEPENNINEPEDTQSSQLFFEKRKLKPNSTTNKKPRRNLNSLICGQALTEDNVYKKIIDYKETTKESKMSKKATQNKGKGKQKSKLGKKSKSDANSNTSEPQPGPSHIYISDTQSDITSDEEDDSNPCCVCKKRSPPGLKDCVDIVIVKWAQCDRCSHWTHLRFCAQERVIRLHQEFLCPCCKQ